MSGYAKLRYGRKTFWVSLVTRLDVAWATWTLTSAESKKLLNKIEAGVGAFGFLYSLAGSTPKYAKYMTWWANAILFVITTFLMGYEYAIRRRGMCFQAVAVPSKKYRTIWQDPLSKTAAIDNAAGARVVSC